MNGRISIRSAVSGALERFPLQRQIYSVLRTTRPSPRLYRNLPLLDVFPVRVDEKASFRMQSHGFASEMDLFWKGLYTHEPASMRLWVQLCRRNKAIFDVGAHVGLYSLVAAAANPIAEVFGFEARKELHGMFIRNAELNEFPKLRPERLAVGNVVGSRNLFFSQLGVRDEGWRVAALARKETVPATTIARYARDVGIRRIDLLKIDAGSAETEVLHGMEDLLYRMAPPMIVEVISDEVGERLEQMLSPVYLYFHIDEVTGVSQRHRIQRLSERSKNYFFCPARRAEEILPLLKEI